MKHVEIEVCKHKVVQNDVRAHEASVETLNAAAARIIAADPNSTAVTQPMVDELNARWHTLVDKLEDIWAQVSQFRFADLDISSFYDLNLKSILWDEILIIMHFQLF